MAGPPVPRWLQALAEPEGRALLDSLRGADVTGEGSLRLGAKLRQRFPAELVASALSQQELRTRAAEKFTHAADMFFMRAGLEQASAEVVSAHRRRRYQTSDTVADLCCGIGGDLIALAADSEVLAVDHDPVHLWMARHNARVYGVEGRVQTRNADVREVDVSGRHAIFVDPARRSAAGRRRVGDSEPPLHWCVDLHHVVSRVGIKAAPGLPHSSAPAGWEMEFVAVERDLKEAVLWSPALATARTRATVLPGEHTLVPAPGDPVEVGDPAEYVLDPNPAVTRAGLVKDLARRLGAHKIDERIAFLASDTEIHSPFARTLRVIDSSPWNEKQLRARLRRHDIGAVDVRRRGLAGDVDLLRRQLKLSGSHRATLIMTRTRDRPWALICVDVPASGGDETPTPSR